MYLPEELQEQKKFFGCNRCKTHLKSSKTNGPATSYWNNLDPGEIPEVMKDLTNPEIRLLSRMLPFIKIERYKGRFGQYGFKGQAILFSCDIFDVA